MENEYVIETVDLIQDEHGKWCEVMEYCPGTTLNRDKITVKKEEISIIK